MRTSSNRAPRHTYPSRYPPGKHWTLDLAWEILDVATPGALSLELRALMAGMIAGELMKERARAARIAERGGDSQIAAAIRKGGA